ncbi:MAG: histidine kinase dimerization/phospho-acceptor domain-containing protein [Nitrosopumilus sp.]
MSEELNQTNFKLKELEQQKMILEEITQSLEQKEFKNQKVLDSMSHEFRTPLVIVKSYVDLILEEKFGSINYKQHEKLEHVQKNIDVLIGVIFETLKKLEKSS